VNAFSGVAFEKQLSIPGLVAFRATHAGETVGIHLWFEQGDVGYGHLGATTARGHELGLLCALCRRNGWFADRLHWLNLGGAGVKRASHAQSGLRAPTVATLVAAEGTQMVDGLPLMIASRSSGVARWVSKCTRMKTCRRVCLTMVDVILRRTLATSPSAHQ